MQTKRGPISEETRSSIVFRQKYKCNNCTVLMRKWEIDHIVRLCDGGEHHESNMQALCIACHREKSADEVRSRSDRAYKYATKCVLSGKLCQSIFGKSFLDRDAYADADTVFAGLEALERGLDSSQIDRYLGAFGLKRQHSPMAIVQTMFAESFGMRVIRKSQAACDPDYQTIVFSRELMKKAELEYIGRQQDAHVAVESTHMDAYPRDKLDRTMRRIVSEPRVENVYKYSDADVHEFKSMHSLEALAWDESYELEARMRDYPQESLVCVRAGMGAGKTQALKRLAATFDASIKALFVTHSRALATKLHSEFKQFGFVHYEHVVDVDIVDAKVVVCLDSLARVTTSSFSFVFLDEAVSLFLHLNSSLMGNKTGIVMSFLELAIIQAKHVYFLDACLDHTFGVSVVDFFAAQKGVSPYWIRNTYVRPTNRRVKFDVVPMAGSNAVSKDSQLTRATNKVLCLLREDKNVVVCSSSKAFTVRLKNFVVSARPGTRMIVYNSDTRESLENVAEYWKTCQLLIYSPTITAGVSFEDPHFDCLVAFVSNSHFAPTVDTTLQQLMRVRQLRDGDMHLYVHEFDAARSWITSRATSAWRASTSRRTASTSRACTGRRRTTCSGTTPIG